jgi:hypothetical protein
MDDDIVVPLPVDSSDDEGTPPEHVSAVNNEACSGAAALLVEEALLGMVSGDTSIAPALFDLDFWRRFGEIDGLHVLEPDGGHISRRVDVSEAHTLRTSLDQRGYLCSAPVFHEADKEILARLKRALRRLKERGLAPTFIYVFDEAWSVIERGWRLLAATLRAREIEGGEDVAEEEVVLEPSFFAHSLVHAVDTSASNGAARAHVPRALGQCSYGRHVPDRCARSPSPSRHGDRNRQAFRRGGQ